MTIFRFGARGVTRGVFLGLAVTATVAALPIAAQAQSAGDDTLLIAAQAQDSGASQRINLTGKLRTLSQTVVGHACYLQAGIAPDTSRALLEDTVEQFAKITNALEFGDPDLGIFGAEERPRTLMGIAKLHEDWDPIMEHAEVVLAGNGTSDDIAAMSEHSAPLLVTAQRMVTVISSQYAQQNEMRQADAVVIDLAGRQRTLSQQMAKDVCLINAGITVPEATTELQAARDNFNNTLSALSSGMPALGIAPPPTAEISEELAAVAGIWQSLAPSIDAVLGGAAIDAEKLAAVMNGADAMTAGMDRAVQLYSENSKFDS